MSYYEHIAQFANNQVKCILCDDIINNSDMLLEAHLHDKKHKELYKKNLMTTNNIISGTVDLFCYICNHNIPISELISHVQSSNHQTKYSAIKNLVTVDGGFVSLPELKSSHSSAYCIICSTPVEFIHDSVKRHLISPNHIEAKAMALQPLNGIFSVQGHDQYLWCRICEVYFDNYIEVIFQHVYESDHAKKIAKLLLISGEDIELEKYLQDHKEYSAFCTKCNVKVACNVDNLQSHVKGKQHLKNSS